MRNLVIILILSFLSLRGYAQPTTVYTVSTISQMKTYYGTANRIHVTSTGEDYQICSPCTADEVNVYLGTGLRRWKKVVPDTYLQNGIGNGDTIMRNQSDTFYYKRISLIDGTGITVGKSHTSEQLNYTLNAATASATTAGILPSVDYARSYTRQTAASNPTGTITYNVSLGGQQNISLTSSGGRTLAFSNLRSGDIVGLTFNNTSGGTIVLTLPSNSYVAGTGSAASVTLPTGRSVLTLVSYDGTDSYYSLQSF